jgi:hypothetical protein
MTAEADEIHLLQDAPTLTPSRSFSAEERTWWVSSNFLWIWFLMFVEVLGNWDSWFGCDPPHHHSTEIMYAVCNI